MGLGARKTRMSKGTRPSGGTKRIKKASVKNAKVKGSK